MSRRVPGRITEASFHADEVNDGITETEFSGRITHLTTAISTMDLALRAAQSGARCGVWVADEQLAGRGRGGNRWHSAAGNQEGPAGLYMTALTAPPIPVLSALQLSTRVAVAVQAGIAATTGLRIRDEIDIRWPNDLMVARPSGRQRKCGGILIDTASTPASPPAPAMLRYALIGIGINLNHLAFPPELDPIATSLRRELPSQPLLRREPLMAAILRELDKSLRDLASAEPAIAGLDTYSSWINGKRVRVEARPGDQQTAYTGTTAGLDRNGFLRVATDDGGFRTVHSGGLREP